MGSRTHPQQTLVTPCRLMQDYLLKKMDEQVYAVNRHASWTIKYEAYNYRA
ncbi:unnamed protein product [Sphenostylis stenocarpa]|uniref:Uncharacterized protein n=1 Tax=Sphenostylis stenocarpa TaxID=92480 RepID=A0AA86S264_9FABA|nr:unnamed protein product [Sphenostylis stenocarpa]